MADEHDPRAAFCRRHHPRLVGALTLYCGDPDAAADAAQEALARACLHWDRVSAMASPQAWLFRVAFNEVKRAVRVRGRERDARGRAAAVRRDGSGHEAAVVNQVVVAQALASLPRRQRMAVVLRFQADLSVADVAVLMRCQPGTVKALTHQGIASLRAQIAFDDAEVITDAP